MKNILLTGASRGLGLEICKNLLEQNYDVFAVSRTFSRELKQLQNQFATRLHFKNVDLSNPQKAKEDIFNDDFISSRTQLSGVVNNAAQAYDDIITNLNISKLETMFNTNVFTPMNIVKYAIRNMILNRIGGSIVHISSISVHTGYKGLAMYAASKGAIEAFSKNTAREWGEKNIRSNIVVAGFMDTAMSATLTEEQKDRIYKRTSQKKATEVASVAKTVAFLLSDDSYSITGQNIHVDAGTI